MPLDCIKLCFQNLLICTFRFFVCFFSSHLQFPRLLIPITQSITKWMTFNCAGSVKAQANSGAVVLSDDLKNPAMEKLDLVRKWSINTYKVNLIVLDLFLCPSTTFLPLFILVPLFLFSHLIRIVVKKLTATNDWCVLCCFRLFLFVPSDCLSCLCVVVLFLFPFWLNTVQTPSSR